VLPGWQPVILQRHAIRACRIMDAGMPGVLREHGDRRIRAAFPVEDDAHGAAFCALITLLLYRHVPRSISAMAP